MIKFLCPILWSSLAWAQAFHSGNEFRSYELEGRLVLTCYGSGQEFVRVVKKCQMNSLMPVSKDYLITEESIPADRVELISRKSEVEYKSGNFSYDPNRKRTTRHVPLWEEFSHSASLLMSGYNFVSYRFTNSQGHAVKEGVFGVSVEDMGRLSCRDGNDVSYDISDCRDFSPPKFCRPYFEQQAFCGAN